MAVNTLYRVTTGCVKQRKPRLRETARWQVTEYLWAYTLSNRSIRERITLRASGFNLHEFIDRQGRVLASYEQVR